MSELTIRRLEPADASAIGDCFRRVYGESYGNPVFYDESGLTQALQSGGLCSVGAIDPDGNILGHMAMSRVPGAGCAELGNTVVDPEARGGGVAWQVGAELTRWCRECGYWGFLHYPTTDHHIMQRQSVKQGFETGVMLGYIPAETDGGVRERAHTLRQAVTIVFEPLASAPPATLYLPERLAPAVESLNAPINLPRTWRTADQDPEAASAVTLHTDTHRRLARLTFRKAGQDLSEQLGLFLQTNEETPCLQVDMLMSDPGHGAVYTAALEAGFVFAGWLPGYAEADVLRLQKVDARVTEMAPDLVNPTASELLRLMGGP